MSNKYSFKVFIGGYKGEFDNYNEIKPYIDKALGNKIKTEQIEIVTACDKGELATGITNIAEVYWQHFNRVKPEGKTIIGNRIINERPYSIFNNKRDYENALDFFYTFRIIDEIDACLIFKAYWVDALHVLVNLCIERNIPLIVYDCNPANGKVVKLLSKKEVINQIEDFLDWRENFGDLI